MNDYDVVIVGAGILGLSVAYQVQKKQPRFKIAILEKESSQALHQTGRNSGVLHSGIYYKTGSQKAINCRLGKMEMEAFCQEENIPFEICGKVIVATAPEEIEQLHKIYERGVANQVKCKRITHDELKELEPHCNGLEAIHVPECGIVDYKAVCKKIVSKILNHGNCDVFFNCEVKNIVKEKELLVVTSKKDLRAKYIVNCAGLYSDKLGAMTLGKKMPIQIIPFKGEYYELVSNKHLCKNLIYPVPNLKYPFLGVHFTRMTSGKIECGPNAILAFGREAYSNWNIQFRELFEALFYKGFLKLAFEHGPVGLRELWRSFNKATFVKDLQQLIPEVRTEDLSLAPCGIRAQAIRPDGKLEDDFLVVQDENIIHVLNAPSPAATSSFQIAKEILRRIDCG